MQQILNVAILILLMICEKIYCQNTALNYPDIPVTYRVLYNETDRTNCPLMGDTSSPGEVRLVVPQGINGIKLMEAAVAKSTNFRFTASFSRAGLGYLITSINGTASDVANSCFWIPSFKPYLAKELIVSPVGISSYYPSFNAVLEWEYRQFDH